MKIEVKINGVKQVLGGLKKAAEKHPAAVGAAMYEEGQAIQAASQLLVPVDTGRCRASAYTNVPKTAHDGPEVKVGYGVDYSLALHERTNVYHETGQAKFLEIPFNAAMKDYVERLSKRVSEHIKKDTDFAIPGGTGGGE